ncbi:MAG: tRNA (N(6)-L-threonylcarbamoyladenosine(37)-C(2))-methylthiotransferase MtaB [Deltaproteobacteria bacterium]
MKTDLTNNVKEPLRAAIVTLGCKANRYDSSALEDLLRSTGISVVAPASDADAYIINTCTVTARTDHHSRQEIRRIRRANRGAIVIVTGCYAQVSPDEINSIEGVDYIVGNPHKDKIAGLIMKGRALTTEIMVGHGEEGTPLTLRARSSGGRTRANLKVQDGCDKRCAYCIIPKARGTSRSLPPASIEAEIEAMIEAGYREIVLTGIHLGAYGADLPNGESLAALLRMIEKRRFPCRFRVSSLDPDEVTDEIIDLLASRGSLCNHLHLALQSGADSIIREMRRPYTASQFRSRVERIWRAVPEVSIGVDVIAGFPGEGRGEFEATFDLIKDLPISYLHSFPYSKRPGTPAAAMDGQIDRREVRQRCERLKCLDLEKRRAFYKASIGTKAEVLIEGGRDKETGALLGHSRNYIPVAVAPGSAQRCETIEVLLTRYTDKGMIGEPQKDIG